MDVEKGEVNVCGTGERRCKERRDDNYVECRRGNVGRGNGR